MSKKPVGDSCAWTPEPDTDSWDTGCDNKHAFFEGGPRENQYQFCPYCGRTLKAKRIRERQG